MNAIEVQQLFLQIGKKCILSDVSVVLEEGHIHGLIGRNGSGKTMLMKCICGYIRPTRGQVVVGGKVIGADADFAPDVGVIIETPGFIPHYSGYQNLRFLADLQKKIGREEICAAMARVGLDAASRLPVKKYSLGMRQRLGLAQAIMEKPSILILDEPFNGLDKEGVLEMRRYLLELRDEGKTILLASHSAEDISILCDTVCEMDKGKLREIYSHKSSVI